MALRLAAEQSARVLLHGDLTPVNTLDGGDARRFGRVLRAHLIHWRHHLAPRDREAGEVVGNRKQEQAERK